jgi:membrane associated rhomboid family serine protease
VQKETAKRFPIATVSVFVITGIVTGLQFAFPGMLDDLRRDGAALAQHEWWRLITPLFVHAEGWRQIGFVFPAMLIVGLLVERLFGSRRWLVLYFVGGLVGELAGYAWKPTGAGASVAVAGLLGALATWLIVGNRRPQGIAGGTIILLGAVVLTFVRDLHGPPIVAGGVMGWWMLRSEAREAVVKRS